MKKTEFEFDLDQHKDFAQAPTFSGLNLQMDGTLWGSFLFATSPLQKFTWDKQSSELLSVSSENIERVLGADSMGIWSGLGASSSGDTIFSSIHKGSLKGFLKIFGKDLTKMTCDELDQLSRNDAGGGTVRHSIVERNSGKWMVRRGKEPGFLNDVIIVGDFVFGLTPTAVFKEPYLKTEKREVLRSDVMNTSKICRDAAGLFWFVSETQKLLRMELGDRKPKVAFLKVPGNTLGNYAASSLDTWMYAIADDGKALVRIRINPISFEEEYQLVSEFEGRAQDLRILGNESTAQLFVTETSSQGVRLLSYELEKLLDPEEKGRIPKQEMYSEVSTDPECRVVMESHVESHDSESARKVLWLGLGPKLGSLESKPLKVLTFADL